MSIGVKVEGARELRRTMRQAGEDVKQLTGLHKRISTIATERARELAPVVTGRMKSGIRATASAGKAGVRIYPRTVPYGGVQEYGWGRKKIPAKRFIRNAVEETKAQWVKEYETGIAEIIERIKGTNPINTD